MVIIRTQTRRPQGTGPSRRFLPTGITKRMFLSVIGFGTVLIALSTAVIAVISSQYLSQNLREQLDNQTRQIIHLYDQKMGSLSTSVITAYNQSSIQALFSGSYSGYQAYTVSRNSYNHICAVSNINRHTDMYLFIPRQNYVMGSSSGDVSSRFDIAASPHTAPWYTEISSTYSTVNIRADFVPPISGGESRFAYIMTLHTPSDWTVKGFIVATLEKDFLDELLEGTFLEDRGFLVVLDPEGALAYTSNPELAQANSHLIPAMEYFQERPPLVRENGLARYYMVSDLSTYGEFRFIAFADKSFLNAAVFQLLAVIFLVLWVLFLLMLAGGFFISRQMSRPIREITAFIHQLEQDSFNGRLRLNADDEIGDLARSFNAMLDSVQENQILRRQAQLNSLQKQISPHFLFNTLETVKALAIRKDTQGVCTALQSLGDMFRYSTNRDNRSTTLLRSELQHVQNYLHIQHMRFGKRLQYELAVEERLLDCVTLKFILQPIVENSLHYAMEGMDGSYLLRISIQPAGQGDIRIQIADNGPGIEAKKLRQIQLFLANQGSQGEFGIGMKNIAQRLSLYFSEPYGLSIDSVEGAGVTVTLLLPERRGLDVPRPAD